MQRELRESFTPSTVIQRVALDRILSAIWRYKLALRMEALGLTSGANFEDEMETSTSSELAPWYTYSLNVQRQIRKKLCELREEVEKSADSTSRSMSNGSRRHSEVISMPLFAIGVSQNRMLSWPPSTLWSTLKYSKCRCRKLAATVQKNI